MVEIAGYRLSELMLIVFALHTLCAMLLLTASVEWKLGAGRRRVVSALVTWGLAAGVLLLPIRAGTIMFINGMVLILILQSLLRVVRVFRVGFRGDE